MTDDDLIALGQAVRKAYWNTPLHQTFGRSDEDAAKYSRLNDIAIGRSLLLLTDDAGFRIPERADVQ